MASTIEPINTIELGGGAVFRTYVMDPGWLTVDTATDKNGTTRLFVFRSAAMKDTHRTYTVVRKLIAQLGAELISQDIERDEDYICRRRETLIFEVGGGGGRGKVDTADHRTEFDAVAA